MSSVTNYENAFSNYSPPSRILKENQRKSLISTEEKKYFVSLLAYPGNVLNGRIQWQKIVPLANEWLEFNGLEGNRTSKSYSYFAKALRNSETVPSNLKIKKNKPKKSTPLNPPSEKVTSVYAIPNNMNATGSALANPQPKSIKFLKKDPGVITNYFKKKHLPIIQLVPFYRKQTEHNLTRTKPANWNEWNRGTYQGSDN